MNAPKAQPDIEIYIKNGSLDDMLKWLSTHFSGITAHEDWAQRFDAGKMITTEVRHKDARIPLMITPGAAGKAFTSVWFKSAQTPWHTDLDCARDCAVTLNMEVRCSAGSWQEDEALDSEQWWVLKGEQERLVRWG